MFDATSLAEYRKHLLQSEACMSLLMKRCISYAAIERFMLGYDPSPTSFMKDRLVFPIRDEYGGVVAYQGRALKPAMEPKYWHTGGDWKGRILWGMFECGELAYKKGYVGLIEGNFDVLSGYDAGVPPVGTMGGALSPHQCIILRRYVKQAVIFRDMDKAGEAAAIRFKDTLAQYDIRAFIEQMPYKTTKDLNDVAVQKGLTWIERVGYSMEMRGKD